MQQSHAVLDDRVESVRRFNRFHTRLVGALNEKLLASPYSLPQLRVLYEIASADGRQPISASELSRSLRMDRGYLSRLLSSLEADGLIDRAPSDTNAKRLVLRLTATGRAAFRDLDAASAGEVAGLLGRLPDTDQRRLVGAMARIERLLGGSDSRAPFILRDPEPGDFGWIIHRHGALYASEYAWDRTFEILVAEIVGTFARSFDPQKERCWVAEQEGEIVGSVFLVRQDDEVAKLRLLYVEPDARGQGLGRSLVDACIRFARAKGYRRIVLWTNDVLVAARRLYEASGFELTEEEPHHSFGQNLVGQTWEMTLGK